MADGRKTYQMSRFSKYLSIQVKKIGVVSDLQEIAPIVPKWDGKSEVEDLAPLIAKWEGGYVDDPVDRGGATNMGVTLATWQLLGYDKNGDGKIDKKDMKLLTHDDFAVVLKKYWDRWGADGIKNQSIANILVDWVWGSGNWGIVIPQRDILKVPHDGKVGSTTLTTLNAMIDQDAKGLFDKIYTRREKYLLDIVTSSVAAYEKKIGRKATEREKKLYTQAKFINGWLNRLRDFKFTK